MDNLLKFVPYIGIPYLAHGRKGDAGLDCWGLVMQVSREVYGVTVPDYTDYLDPGSAQQVSPLFDARHTWQRIEVDAMQPGDVIVINLLGHPVHAGIYVGDDKMLHTLTGCDSCLIRIDSAGQWRRRIEGAYRWRGNSY